MDEKDLIRKISVLRQIKPRKNWVLLTKNQILGQEPQKESLPFWRVFQFVLKPAYALSVVLLAVLAAGAVIYFSNQPGEEISPRISSTNNINTRAETLTPALEQLQANLAQAKENLENAKLKPKKVLAVGKSVKSITESGKSLMSQIKGEGTSTQVLASLNRSIEELEESNQAIYKARVEQLLSDLDDLTLTSRQEKLFNQAVESYEAGNYEIALEEILQLPNNN